MRLIAAVGAAVGFMATAAPAAHAVSSAPPGRPQVLGIAVMLPTTGPSGGLGRSALAAVELAAQQSNRAGAGYVFRVDPYDDWSPWADDATIVWANIWLGAGAETRDLAMIEGLTSMGITKRVVPIINTLGLPTIFPTASNPGLSLERYSACEGLNYSLLHPAGRPNNAFFLAPYDPGCQNVSTALSIGDRFSSWYALRSGEKSAARAAFRQAYAARYGTEPKMWADLYYDAALVEIRAIRQRIQAGGVLTREGIRQAIQRVRYNDGGLLFGSIGFASNGTNSGLAYDWAASASARKIRLHYNAPIVCATVDGNGSDYHVTWSGGVNPAPVRATCANTGAHEDGVVILRLTGKRAIFPGDTYRVSAQRGTDGNTVSSRHFQSPRGFERVDDFTSGVFGP